MVRQLRKENKKLRSELEMLRDVIDVDEIKQERREKIIKKKSLECTKCGSIDLEISEFGIYRLIECVDCGLRNREKISD